MTADRSLSDLIYAAYVECALWSSLDVREPLDTEAEPFDDWATESDLADETRATFRHDLETFTRDEYTEDVRQLWTPEQFGHDFWLTRNGHGAGFWDRYYAPPGEAIGRRLTDAAHAYGDCDLYTGDDGRIYC